MLRNKEQDAEKSIMLEGIVFPCDICKEDIVIGNSSQGIKVISKQTNLDDFFGTLETYHIESACEANEIHVNIVVIDGQKRYRGHKYSTIKTSEPVEKKHRGNIRLLLGIGKDLAKFISSSLQGCSLILCGDSPTTTLWANTLQELFTLSPFIRRKWIISETEFKRKFDLNPIKEAGEFILIDDSLLKIVRKKYSKITVVDLRKNKVYNAKEKEFAKNFVAAVMRIPETQHEAVLNYVTIQVEWLKRLLEELKGEMESSIVETAACPIGNLAETVKINAVLDQVITEKVLGDLRARMRPEEFEIVIAHLLREVPALNEIVHH